ncbi:protein DETOXIFICATION 45, chloroplastic isoform X1 [Zea mays]|uniref:Protein DETOXIFICATION n=2 Tax=Zea mays TaxID=4577 RepID=A0A804QBQ0_MAIZE|nr:protein DETOXIFICATION 45, chloroplastic isoform X1 [Zea mays]|eukprot:XP_020396793.1 protein DETOXIFICATION 45, chloroplastic isoform X1 [Zea mays]
MEFAAGAAVAPRPMPAGPGRNRRVGGGAIGIGWARRATAPGLSLAPAVARRAASASGGGHGRVVVRSTGGGCLWFRGEGADGDRSSLARASPSDGAAPARSSVREQTIGIKKELFNLAVPAIVGQAIDPVAQLLETAYVGRLGPVELASAAVGMSVFNIISKLFNIPLLSITTSFVAEDVSKHDSSQYASGNISGKVGERKRLPSISSALLLAAAIGVIEALALILGSGILLNIMGVSHASAMHNPARLFLSVRALGAPAVVVSLAIQGVFRGLKDTKTPLLYSGLGNISAVVLLPFFVYSLNLGLTGAALATIASQYIGMFLLLWSLSKRAVLLPPKMKDLEFVGYIKSGGMLLGRTLSVLITMTLGTAMAARQGTVAMAAHQICLQVWLAVSLLSDALAVSAQALIASSFAKLDYEKVEEVTFYVLKAGVFVGIALALLLFVSFGRLAEIFSKDPMVIQIVRSGVLFVSASQPINALAFIFDGLHFGVSDFSYSASSMMVVGAISSLFLLCAPRFFGLLGVWAGLALFMSLRMTAGFMRLGWRAGPWWFLHRKEPKYRLQ